MRLTNGAAVRLTGRLVSSPGKGQSCELLVDQSDVGEVVVLGECDPEAIPILLLARFDSIKIAFRRTLFKRKRQGTIT